LFALFLFGFLLCFVDALLLFPLWSDTYLRLLHFQIFFFNLGYFLHILSLFASHFLILIVVFFLVLIFRIKVRNHGLVILIDHASTATIADLSCRDVFILRQKFGLQCFNLVVALLIFFLPEGFISLIGQAAIDLVQPSPLLDFIEASYGT
jgi:hypothetical protein